MKNKLLITLCILPLTTHANMQGIYVVKGLKKNNPLLAVNHFDLAYPKMLMSVESREKKSLLNANIQADPYNTHLKNTMNTIPLAISFKTVPNLDKVEVIGFAPIGTVKNNSWTGMKEFFKRKDLGICEYSKVQIIAMQIDASSFTRAVNNKISVAKIQGNDKAGYLYTVNWFEEDKEKYVMKHTLNCANLSNDKSILKKMIEISSAIDKQYV